MPLTEDLTSRQAFHSEASVGETDPVRLPSPFDRLAASALSETWIVPTVYLLDGVTVGWALSRMAGSDPWADVLNALTTFTGLAFAWAATVAVRRQPRNPLAVLLVLVGVAMYAEDLAWSGHSIIGPYLIAASTPVLLHLTLAYPWGRLEQWWSRVAVAVGYAWGIGVPGLLEVCREESWARSAAACSLGSPLLEAGNVLTTLTMMAVIVYRTIVATPDLRRLYTPLLFVAGAAVIPAIWITLPVLPADEREGVRIAYQFAMMCLPLAFLLGVVRLPRALSLLADVSEMLRTAGGPAGVEAVLRQALRDDTVRIGLWHQPDHGYRSVDGTKLQISPGSSTFSEHSGHRVALVRGPRSWIDPQVQAVAVRLAAFALAHHQAAEDERRRLRRDLHDSAQQLLVATALKLRMAEDGIAAGKAVSASTLAELRGDVLSSLDQLRRISHGEAVPPGLDLRIALEAIAERTPAVRLSLDTPAGLDSGPVQAAYFIVAEAVTNALTHGGASDIAVTVTPWTEESWRVSISDNGGDPGEAPLERAGGGIEGLRRRAERLGGSLDVRGTSSGVVVDAVLPRREVP